MNVVECDVPSGGMLSREAVERAYFRCSYRAPLSRGELGIIDVFFSIFRASSAVDEAAPDCL